jgi:hypothetical protein
VTRDSWPQLGDDANGLVTDNQSRFHRVFAPHDVEVRTANRRQGYSDDGLAVAGAWDRHLLEAKGILSGENIGFHSLSHLVSCERDRLLRDTLVTSGMQVNGSASYKRTTAISGGHQPLCFCF